MDVWARNIIIADELSQSLGTVKYNLKRNVKQSKLTVVSRDAELIKNLEEDFLNCPIIFINICFKYHPDTKRTEFAGIKRIIKEALRINWLRREPVIAYGTLPEDELLNCPMGQIFKSNRHHLYFDLTKINEIDLNGLIDSVSPIPDEDTLREIIIKYCTPELKDFLRTTVHHYLEKTYKLDNNFEAERKQFLWRLRHVEKILPDLGTEEMHETLQFLEGGNEDKKSKIKENLKSILKDIKKKEEELAYVSS